MTVDYRTPTRRIPLSERINMRAIVFVGVLGLIIGYPVYVLIDSQLSGGIKNVGDGYTQVDLKAMSTFTFDQVGGTKNDIPEKWRALDGKKVVLYGEMWQPYTADDRIAGFDLCYSIAKCCFSGPPQVQHFVKSKVPAGKTVEYFEHQVKVTGILHVNVIRDAERVASVYQLDVDSVEAVQ